MLQLAYAEMAATAATKAGTRSLSDGNAAGAQREMRKGEIEKSIAIEQRACSDAYR